MDTWLSFSCCLTGGLRRQGIKQKRTQKSQHLTMKSKNNQRTMGTSSFWIILKYRNVFRATFSILFSRFPLRCRSVSLLGSDFAASHRGFFPPSAFVCVFPPNSTCECFFSRETAVHKCARMTVVVCVAWRWGWVVVAAAGSSRVSVLNCPAFPR